MSEKHGSVGDICLSWWLGEVAADTGRSRKTRAELRRADTPLAVLGVSTVHDLNRELTNAGLHKRTDWSDRLSLIAVALAHVKEGRGETLARRFGAGDPPRLSRIRFNALIGMERPRDLIRPLVRALAVVGGSADVRQLAQDLYWWGDRVRTDWCFEYYGSADAKPNSDNEETDT